MKTLLSALAAFFLSMQSFAWEESQVKECRSKFDNFIGQTMALKFVCIDPATEGARFSFIALQYSSTEYTDEGKEIDLQKIAICSTDYRAASLHQSNNLITGIGLLKIIGVNGDQTYLNMMSTQNKRVMKSLRQTNCTDAQGRLLTD